MIVGQVYFSFIVFLPSPVSAPHVSSDIQRRVYIKDGSRPNVNRDGETITIDPSQTFDIFCSGTRYAKYWYRGSGQTESPITRLKQTTTSPDVYAINTESYVLTLQFRPFQSTHAGEYECRFTSGGRTLTPLSVFLSKLQPPLLFHYYDYERKQVFYFRRLSGVGLSYPRI